MFKWLRDMLTYIGSFGSATCPPCIVCRQACPHPDKVRYTPDGPVHEECHGYNRHRIAPEKKRKR